MTAAGHTCRLLGHRFSFRAKGATMCWECERDCGAGGSKQYASPAEAAHFATAFDRRDNAEIGKRAPLFGLLPLRIFRWLSDHQDPATAKR